MLIAKALISLYVDVDFQNTQLILMHQLKTMRQF